MVLKRHAGSLEASFLSRALAAKWKMPAELALDVAGLSLYNVIIMAGERASTWRYSPDIEPPCLDERLTSSQTIDTSHSSRRIAAGALTAHHILSGPQTTARA